MLLGVVVWVYGLSIRGVGFEVWVWGVDFMLLGFEVWVLGLRGGTDTYLGFMVHDVL